VCEYLEAPSAESKTLMVGNLSYDASEDDVKDAFDGAVSCRLITHPDGKSKGLVLFILHSMFDEFVLVEKCIEVWAMMTDSYPCQMLC